MRPRVFPAEDKRVEFGRLEDDNTRFNEAAGIPRGRPRNAFSAPMSLALLQ